MSELNKESVEQAGGDERAAFEFFVRKHCGMPEHIAVNWDAKFTNDAWEGWKARAALAQPSLMPPDRGPWHAVKWDGGRRVDLSSDDFEHDVALTVSGDFVEGDKFRYAQELAAWMNAHLAQPSPARSEQAEAERPEVVAWRYGSSGGIVSDKACLDEWKSGGEYQSLMTVAQHERIDAARLASVRVLADEVLELAAQRDAAQARVAELEKQEPVATIAKVPGEDWNGLHFYRDLQGMQPGTKLYAAPVAQAQQLHDLDKQCRDDVARALGLRPSQDRGFAWSYLLASIKSCVKAAEDAAQAQHSVPEGVTIERDVAGTIHIKVGDFDFIQLQYQRPYTDNASTWKLAERIASLLAAAPGKEGV